MRLNGRFCAVLLLAAFLAVASECQAKGLNFFPSITDPGCPACEAPWSLPQLEVLANHGIKVGGWLEQGLTFNSHTATDGLNGPVALNDFDDDYQMNQFWIYIDKKADNGGCGFAWGGHIDMTYGTDSRYGTNYGLETEINSPTNDYGLCIPQMYLEVAFNRLSIKVGHFAGILDYEAVPAPLNPFYSHSLLYTYTVPQLVTGVMAEWGVTDALTLQAGFTRGWVMFEDLNDDLDVMAGVKLVVSDMTTLKYAFTNGAQDLAGDRNRFAGTGVWEQKIGCNWKYIGVATYGYEEGTRNQPQEGEWYGLCNYVIWSLNQSLDMNFRFEALRDDAGVRVNGVGSPMGLNNPLLMPGIRGWDGYGFVGTFYEVSYGLKWMARQNIMVRPELRWDWYSGAPGVNGLPYDDGESDNQFTFATDVIVLF